MTAVPTPFAGRFTLVDPVGSGASGTVWRAFDHRLGGYCAAKVVGAADAGWMLRVIREQGLRLDHPHIVSPYTWVADGDIVVAMELYGGGSLASLLGDHGALPEPSVAAILEQILDALAHTHAAGLIHRDVKPENVLLEVTGLDPPKCLLGDFGLALPRDGLRLTDTGRVVGTPGYLPPEAADGAPPDVRRDLYAAGITAWQLLSGSENPPAEATAVAPGRLWEFVATLAAPDPRKRPADATEALRRLRTLAATPGPGIDPDDGEAEPVEVFDLLPPLPPDAPPGPVLRGVAKETRSFGAVAVDAGAAASSASPIARGPHRSPTTSRATTGEASLAHPTVTTTTPTGTPRSSPTDPAPRARRGPASLDVPFTEAVPTNSLAARGGTRARTRRRLSAAGAAGAVAVAVVIVVALSGPGGDAPKPGRGDAPSTDVPASAPHPPTDPAEPAAVTIGHPCDWYEVGESRTATDGAAARCAYRPDGTYRWETNH